MPEKFLTFQEYLHRFGKPVSGDPGYQDIQKGEQVGILDFLNPDKKKRKEELIAGAEEFRPAYDEYVKGANKMLFKEYEQQSTAPVQPQTPFQAFQTMPSAAAQVPSMQIQPPPPLQVGQQPGMQYQPQEFQKLMEALPPTWQTPIPGSEAFFPGANRALSAPEQQQLGAVNEALLSGKVSLPQSAIQPPSVVTEREKIAAAPEAKEPEALRSFKGFMKEAGIDEKSPEGATLLKDWLKKQTAIQAGASANVNIVQETEEAKKIGGALAEQYTDAQKAAVNASQKLNRYERMEQLLEGVATGKLTPAITEVQAVGQSLGMTVDPSLPAKQAVESLSNQIALELRNPAGGAGMPGQLSDKDREFLVSMTPNLAKTPEGNKLIIQTAKKLARRDQEVAKLARDYRKRKGKLDEGLFDDLQKYSDSHPLFSDERQAMQKASGWSIQKVK